MCLLLNCYPDLSASSVWECTEACTERNTHFCLFLLEQSSCTPQPLVYVWCGSVLHQRNVLAPVNSDGARSNPVFFLFMHRCWYVQAWALCVGECTKFSWSKGNIGTGKMKSVNHFFFIELFSMSHTSLRPLAMNYPTLLGLFSSLAFLIFTFV